MEGKGTYSYKNKDVYVGAFEDSKTAPTTQSMIRIRIRIRTDAWLIIGGVETAWSG